MIKIKAKKIITILKEEMDRTSGGWVEIYETKEFFNNIIFLLQQGEKYEAIFKGNSDN